MVSPIKLNSAIHTSLAYLRENKVATAMKLAEVSKEKVASLRIQGFLGRLLPNAIADGLMIDSGNAIEITALGLQELEKLETRRVFKSIPAPDVVQANLFVKSKEIYNGEELKHRSVRPDAFDYLKCPSVINGKVVPYYYQKRD